VFAGSEASAATCVKEISNNSKAELTRAIMLLKAPAADRYVDRSANTAKLPHPRLDRDNFIYPQRVYKDRHA
jgi:hypothetical protein